MLSDVNILENILNIGNRRERKVFYRKDGTPTLPLPADPYSTIYYMKKGFSLSPPKEIDVKDGVACPLCDFTAKDAFGLSVHLRVHTKKEE